MSHITWNTPVGSLGTIKELDYFEFVLSATDSSNASLEYTHISGNLPVGLRVNKDGVLKGVPVVETGKGSRSIVYTFTVRANTPSGVVADRTFTIIVNNFNSLKIEPRSLFLSTFDDGRFIAHQFTALTENPNSKLTWSIADGEVPLDIKTNLPMTMSSDGLFSGYISRIIDTTGQISGYDDEPNDEFPFDFSATSRDKRYTFNVQVTDGTSFDIVPVTMLVVSKDHFTSDNNITLINNSELPSDADNTYPPIITTDPSVIPTLTVGDRFAFKFEAFDPQGNVIYWAANSSIPNGLTISSVTGWMTGSIPPQTETQKTYTFGIYAYKRDYTNIRSLVLPVSLTTVRDSTNNITWTTNSNVGTLINGTVSEFSITAINNAGKDLTYTLVTGAKDKLPQGLKLLPNGDIVGRSTFEYFSLDGNSANITVSDTTGITTGMVLEGPGIASGSEVIAVYPSNVVKISPATYVTAGSQITFTDGFVNIITYLTDLSTTTSIDGNKTTFDCTFNFTVKAETTDQTVNATKEFSIFVNNYNRAPYENLYLKALPSLDQRITFNNIISNTDIFPTELLYRSQDPWFGKSSDIKMLFLPGLTASSLSEFANSIQLNHYNKRINFGEIKTARAVDSHFNTKYEVVYIDVTDNNAGDSLSVMPSVSNYYNDNSINSTIYPNSFDNMAYRITTGIGFANRGALPDWMTSPQENGKVLGLTRAIVLAYTVPGAAKLIAYRLKNNGITFNNIQFIADRYQIDAGITDIYNPATNSFYPSEETTFDANVAITTFDMDTTNFYNERYKYTEPEIGDKYLIFPQIGVFK